ncbi:hypothetical protein YSY43_34240 [Paenibacillus sp. YSY-4.3]
MNKSVQAVANEQMAELEAAEWFRLLVTAREAGIPIEVVRSFLRRRSASEAEQAAFRKFLVSGSIQEEEEETSSTMLRDYTFRRNL